MTFLTYKQLNSNTDELSKLSEFFKTNKVKSHTMVSDFKSVWHELYHDIELKHLFLVAPMCSTKIINVIVFACNRGVNCYLATNKSDGMIKFKAAKAIAETDPNNYNNLIWTRVDGHPATYPDEVNQAVLESEAYTESTVCYKKLNDTIQSLSEATGITEFPSDVVMYNELRRDAEPFDIELDYSLLPKTVVDHFQTDASIGQLRDGTAKWKHVAATIEENSDYQFDESTIKYITQGWLTIQYYKINGLLPNASEYKQCSCGQWHHRIRTQYCPKCDALNTEYVETLVKDFQVELESNEVVA